MCARRELQKALPMLTEEKIIQNAQKMISESNWAIGAGAAHWTRCYARGRGDSEFGALVGMSGDQIYQRRRVFETFATARELFPNLRWAHFYAALNWQDAAEHLKWANEWDATVAEMRAWRRAQRGEDLTTEPGE